MQIAFRMVSLHNFSAHISAILCLPSAALTFFRFARCEKWLNSEQNVFKPPHDNSRGGRPLSCNSRI
ncbi:hypothetical protein XELAEV_18023977mg [Xenopus laevis]|uniref:Uncharacterized protein n=1 Tax=Xenopus laevis TaxID=8355 RepID=A0A974D547_XENLA|nr:hypothetical protein XELAEV_18023977mg [Xenopus laevis]